MENALKLMHQTNTNCHQMELQIEMLQEMESSDSQSITQWQTQVTLRSTLLACAWLRVYRGVHGCEEGPKWRWDDFCSCFWSKRAWAYPLDLPLATELVYPRISMVFRDVNSDIPHKRKNKCHKNQMPRMESNLQHPDLVTHASNRNLSHALSGNQTCNAQISVTGARL